LLPFIALDVVRNFKSLRITIISVD
jgi:hypothetical protein